MAEDHVIVERSDRSSGMAMGLVVGLVLVVVAVLAIFLISGGPGRFAGPPAPAGQTNVNVPAQQPAAQQPAAQQPGPNIQIPRQIDVNVNQPAPQAPAVQLPQVPVQVPDGSTR